MIRAVLFDLDGTPLPHDFNAFPGRYFGALARRFAEVLPGVDVVGAVAFAPDHVAPLAGITALLD